MKIITTKNGNLEFDDRFWAILKEAGLSKTPRQIKEYEFILKHLYIVAPDIAEKFKHGEIAPEEAKKYIIGFMGDFRE
jgi:hypothetical protein